MPGHSRQPGGDLAYHHQIGKLRLHLAGPVLMQVIASALIP